MCVCVQMIDDRQVDRHVCTSASMYVPICLCVCNVFISHAYQKIKLVIKLVIKIQVRQ